MKFIALISTIGLLCLGACADPIDAGGNDALLDTLVSTAEGDVPYDGDYEGGDGDGDGDGDSSGPCKPEKFSDGCSVNSGCLFTCCNANACCWMYPGGIPNCAPLIKAE